MKTYQSGIVLAILAGIAVLFLIVVLIFTAAVAVSPGRSPDLTLLAAGSIFGLIFVGISCFFLPFVHTITIQNRTAVEFRSVLKRTVLSPKEIKSIEPLFAGRFVLLTHAGGTLRLDRFTSNFTDFLSQMKALNPSIAIKV